MDWSLVLVSQGIEATIEKAEHGFELIVPAVNYDAALDAIQKYRAENRSWPWRHVVFREGLVFDWASVSWVILIAVFHWINSRTDLVTAGMMDSSAVVKGQWWRLFTAVWLHGDIGHIATNAVIGFILLGLAMGRFGIGAALAGGSLNGALVRVGMTDALARSREAALDYAARARSRLGAESHREELEALTYAVVDRAS